MPLGVYDPLSEAVQPSSRPPSPPPRLNTPARLPLSRSFALLSDAARPLAELLAPYRAYSVHEMSWTRLTTTFMGFNVCISIMWKQVACKSENLEDFISTTIYSRMKTGNVFGNEILLFFFSFWKFLIYDMKINYETRDYRFEIFEKGFEICIVR